MNSVTFTNNSATLGSAIYIKDGDAELNDITATDNSRCPVRILHSNTTTMIGFTKISNNNDNGNSGIVLSNSVLYLMGSIEIVGNGGHNGAAIRAYESQVYLCGIANFAYNSATGNGGAIYAFDSAITLNGTANFTSNSAQMSGGAMYLESSTLNLYPHSSLITSDNHALLYGGAIYYEDAATISQCKFRLNGTLRPRELPDGIVYLPQCFIKLKVLLLTNDSIPYTIISHRDRAEKNGNFLYGGLLDKCRIFSTKVYTKQEFEGYFPFYPIVPYEMLLKIVHIQSEGNSTEDVTSQPYQLCFCEINKLPDCTGIKSMEVYRGQEFTLSLIAYAQGNISTSAQVIARTHKTASLNLNQSLQTLQKSCSNIVYNVYSIAMSEVLTLYVDGPCRDTGLSTALVHVTLRPCPDGFNKSNDRCECDERLQVYDAECIIQSEERIYMKRKDADSVLFWISTLYNDNRSYEGLILYGTCPPEFCKTEPVQILLDDLDSQCNYNRSGKLCGACAANYSLLLGNSRCQICYNSYLSMLLVFATAGIALVIFLTFLRLTVATGFINSVILYANMVQVNKIAFFPVEKENVLTVFIAWMNLDFGFSVCFYEGMDAYAQTWLQFAFPIYIWIIITLIIVISRYSIVVSRLIGNNPIAVLAIDTHAHVLHQDIEDNHRSLLFGGP